MKLTSHAARGTVAVASAAVLWPTVALASPAPAARADSTTPPVTVYVANSSSDTVTPISAATNEPDKPITVGPGPSAIAITPVTPGGAPTSCQHTSGQ